MRTRILHTKFWKDSYIRKLSAGEKLIFNYLITNEKVNIIHCYEIDFDEIVFDLGLSLSMVREAIRKFQQDKKIAYFSGWVFLGNAMRYERYIGNKNEIAKKRLLQEMSKSVLDWYSRLYDRGMIGVYIPPINHKSEIINHNGVVKGAILDDKNFIEELKIAFPDHDVALEIIKMKDWLASEGKVKQDYAAFARNWLRNEFSKPAEKAKVIKIR